MKALRILAALLVLGFAPTAHAQIVFANTVATCGTPNNTPVANNSYPLTQDETGKLCTNAAVTASITGTTSNATSGVATSSTNIPTVSYNYGFNGTTWDQLQVDASKYLKINCVTGCAGGSASNASSAVATSSTNGTTNAWMYAFNGTTWDQLQDDASKNLKVLVNAAIPAGTNLMGKVGIDQTTPGTTNGVQVLTGSTTAVTQGTAANLNATVVGTGTLAVQAAPTASSSGGAAVSSKQVANNTTSVAIDASPGTLYQVSVWNNSATIAYLKLYNTAQGSVTCGSGTPVQRILIPANTAGAGAVISYPVGIAYGTAITSCVTTGFADADATAPAASTYIVEFIYK